MRRAVRVLLCAVVVPLFLGAEEGAVAKCHAVPCAIDQGPSALKEVPASCLSRRYEQITPPAEPLLQCNNVGLFATADFIWWKAQQDGLAYAFNGGQADGGIQTTFNSDKGYMYTPNFTYEPGFKIGLEALSSHDNWGVSAQYTWLQVPLSATTSRAVTSDNVNLVLQGTNVFSSLGISPAYTEVSSQWGLRFNVLDFELGRNFWISPSLTVRPQVGIKCSWLKQDSNIDGIVIINGVLPTNSRVIFDFDLSQLGVGLRTGVDTAFYPWNHWAIFGDLAITGLWNRYKSARKDFYIDSPGSPAYINLDVVFNPSTVTAVLEIALGLRFETIFSQGKYFYTLQAGWENQIWLNQGQFIHVHNPSSSNNLILQGLTLRTGLFF